MHRLVFDGDVTFEAIRVADASKMADALRRAGIAFSRKNCRIVVYTRGEPSSLTWGERLAIDPGASPVVIVELYGRVFPGHAERRHRS